MGSKVVVMLSAHVRGMGNQLTWDCKIRCKCGQCKNTLHRFGFGNEPLDVL